MAPDGLKSLQMMLHDWLQEEGANLCSACQKWSTWCGVASGVELSGVAGFRGAMGLESGTDVEASEAVSSSSSSPVRAGDTQIHDTR